MSLQDTMQKYGQMTEVALQNYLGDVSGFPMLHQAMSYSLFAGGKRIRPVMCLAAAELMEDGAAEKAVPAACAMEMIHTYSLIHDDLPAMDNDDFRRGKPSNHKAFGEANAILAGDGLLSKAFEILGTVQNPRVISLIAKGAMDMVCGQSLDLNPVEGKTDLIRLHALKTGALIKASVLAGAFSVGADQATEAALTEFSEHYGLLFQITDDILDVIGNAEVLGKSIGKDAVEDKMTFVTCYGLEEAKQQAADEAEAAEYALGGFGERADFFRELIRYTLMRER